jgi:elongation factor 1-beta
LAKIVVALKIFPKDAGGNLDELKRQITQALPEDAEVHRFDEDPIAFGLVALIAQIAMPEEKTGILDRVENAIRAIPEVSELEVTMVRRI